MLGRPIVNKHRSYAFHRPSALWLAQIVVDLAFGAVRILVFAIMVYFMCHLVRDAGAFFTFYLVIVSGYLAMTLFFRTVGCLVSFASGGFEGYTSSLSLLLALTCANKYSAPTSTSQSGPPL